MCSSEPNVTVEVAGQKPVVYQQMDADRMRQIFRRHVLKGEVQTAFALVRQGSSGPGAQVMAAKKAAREVSASAPACCTKGGAAEHPRGLREERSSPTGSPARSRSRPGTAAASAVSARWSGVAEEGVVYLPAQAGDAAKIVKEHLAGGTPVERLRYKGPGAAESIPMESEHPFFKNQLFRVMRNRG